MSDTVVKSITILHTNKESTKSLNKHSPTCRQTVYVLYYVLRPRGGHGLGPRMGLSLVGSSFFTFGGLNWLGYVKCAALYTDHTVLINLGFLTTVRKFACACAFSKQVHFLTSWVSGLILTCCFLYNGEMTMDWIQL